MLTNPTSPKKKNFWQRIVEPHPSIESFAERRFASVLATLLLALLPLYFLPVGIRAIVEKHPMLNILYFGSGMLILSSAYIFARSPYPRIGSRLTILYFTFIPFIALVTHAERYAGENAKDALIWSVPIMIMALILVRPQRIKFVVFSQIAVYLIIPAIWDGLTYEQIFSTLSVIIAVGGLMIVSAFVQNRYLHKAEKEAIQSKKNERRYKDIFLNSPIALWEIDFSKMKQGLDDIAEKYGADIKNHILKSPEIITRAVSNLVLLDANQAALKLAETDSIKKLRENLNIIANPASALALLNGIIALWEGESNIPIQTVHKTITDKDKIILVRFSIRSGYEESWERVIISIDDITEQSAAEASVRQLAAAVEASASSIVITNMDGTIEYVNPAFSQVTGYSREEAMGENPRVLKSGQHPTSFYQEMWEVLTKGETWTGEIINKKKNNELYWEHASISPVKNEAGEIVNFVAVKDDITKQKKAQRDLRNLSSATEQSASAVVIADMNGIVEYINPAFSKITGYKAEEILGNTLQVLRSYEHEKGFYDNHDDIISHGEIWRGEMINKRKDGSLYWEHQVISPVKNDLGEITHYVSVRDDITEAKEAEEKIQQQSEFLQTIINGIDSPFYVLNVADYSIALANEKAQGLGTVTGSTCYSLIHKQDTPCDSKEYPCPLKQVLQHKEAFSVEHIHYHSDGTPYYVEVYGYPIFDKKGNVVQMIEYSIDITARKEAEEELRKLSSATQQAASGIVITNTKGIIEFANPATLRITGYSAEEFIGGTPNLLKSGEHTASFYDELWKTIENGDVWRGELINRRKDGSFYWESQIISPVINSQGEITHYVAVKEDITRRKELEQSLALAHEEVLRASDMKTQLLANVSHDMRTPLGAILGYTEMLDADVFGQLNGAQAEATRAIAASSQKLLNFVSDLLNQAQIETGEIVLNESLFEPQQLLDGLGGEISLAKTQGLNINTLIGDNLPNKLTGDIYWLGQIIHNLLSNAIKFTYRGGEINIRLLRSGDYAWKLEVEDNGKGIPREAQAYIFESFRQVDGSITREAHTGSGLGLSIVSHLVRLMRGEIRLESELGKGSKFIILFPIKENKE